MYSWVGCTGKEAVALEAYKDGDANTVQVCTHVKDALGFKRARSFSERLSEAMAKTRGITPGESAVERGDPTEMLARKIRSRLPRTVQFTLISDQSRFIIAAINEAQGAAIQGGMWALLVIFLFLQRLSATVIIGWMPCPRTWVRTSAAYCPGSL